MARPEPELVRRPLGCHLAEQPALSPSDRAQARLLRSFVTRGQSHGGEKVLRSVEGERRRRESRERARSSLPSHAEEHGEERESSESSESDMESDFVYNFWVSLFEGEASQTRVWRSGRSCETESEFDTLYIEL